MKKKEIFSKKVLFRVSVSISLKGGVCHFWIARKAAAKKKGVCAHVPYTRHVHIKHAQTNERTNASSEGCSFFCFLLFLREEERKK